MAPTTDVKALMAGNSGKYDIALDPLWNGDCEPKAEPFKKDEIAFYQCDHLGTPQELTDHEGKVAWSAQYKAWGQAKEAISDAAHRAGMRNPIRFQGQYQDAETGFFYNRHRYYDPETARYITQDPIGLAGGKNSHVYAPNPTQWIDPLGLTKKMGDTVCTCTTCSLPKQVSPRNLRSRQTREEMSRSRVEKLAKRMKKDGYDQDYPIEAANVNNQLIIIDGHHRAQAAARAGLEKVPVVVHELDLATAKRLENDMYDARCK